MASIGVPQTFAHGLTGGRGEIVDHRVRPAGISSVKDGAYEAALLAVVGDWLHADSTIKIIASGMITSRQGWVELDYKDCPVDPTSLAKATEKRVLTVGNSIYFVTGLRHRDASGQPDIMRGEETQIAGLIATGYSERTIVILPGTHSKWAQLDDNRRILQFQTFMTGEIYAVLSRHSILSHSLGDSSPENSPDSDAGAVRAFIRGCETAKESQGRVLNRLFHTRTLSICDAMTAGDARQYLSGLLIGAEIVEGLQSINSDDHRIVLIGEPDLVEWYSKALTFFGHSADISSPTVTADGLWSQYQSLVSM